MAKTLIYLQQVRSTTVVIGQTRIAHVGVTVQDTLRTSQQQGIRTSHSRWEHTYPGPRIPENLLHVPKRPDLSHHGTHPVGHPRRIILTLRVSRRRRKLRDPNLLIRSLIMHPLDLINSTLGLHAVDMCANDADLVHASRAVALELLEPVAAGVGHSGRDQLRRGSDIDQWLEVCCGVCRRSNWGEAPKREVRLVEQLEIAKSVTPKLLLCSVEFRGVCHHGDPCGFQAGRLRTCGAVIEVVVCVGAQRLKGEGD